MDSPSFRLPLDAGVCSKDHGRPLDCQSALRHRDEGVLEVLSAQELGRLRLVHDVLKMKSSPLLMRQRQRQPDQRGVSGAIRGRDNTLSMATRRAARAREREDASRATHVQPVLMLGVHH